MIEQDKTDELIGGLKNALERGETLAKAKQSFLNAGYKSEEVEEAAKHLVQPSALTNQPKQLPQQEKQDAKSLPIPKKKQSRKLIIILIIILALILIGAVLLGIFWSKIF